MNKRGGLEMSVNAIVILIIALAVMGMVIGFAVSKFKELGSELVLSEDTEEASPRYPIEFPRGKAVFEVKRVTPLTMTVNVYNRGTEFDASGTHKETIDGSEVDVFNSLVVCGTTIGKLTAKTLDVSDPRGLAIDDPANPFLSAVGFISGGQTGDVIITFEPNPAANLGKHACIITIGTAKRSIFLEYK